MHLLPYDYNHSPNERRNMKRLTDRLSHCKKGTTVSILLALIRMIEKSSLHIGKHIEATGLGTILITLMLFVIPDAVVRTIV